MSKIKAWFVWVWDTHIQKVLGYLVASIGFITFIDGQTYQVIASIHPVYGPLVSHALQIASGLIIAYRAHQVK